MPDRWNEYVHHANVARFQRLLNEAADEQTRKFLRGLLAEEDANARAHNWLPWGGVVPSAGAYSTGPGKPPQTAR